MARKIRVSVDVNYSGIDVPTEYHDLPDDWDEMTRKDRDAHLAELGALAMETVATYGACVVDENDNEVEED